MSVLLSKRKVLLVGIEAEEGVEETLSASTDAVAVENLKITISPNIVSTNEHNNSLDASDDIIGGMMVDITFDVYLKGSGVAATPPEFGPLLKACGWAEVITASAVPASAQACADGGSTTTAILGSSASASAHTYRGMPVLFSAGVSATAFISDYTSGKVATLTDELGGAVDDQTSYQIPANVLYKPASDDIPTLTMNIFEDGLLKKVKGARGSMKFTITSGGAGKMSFSFKGIFISKTDSALPTATYDSTKKPIFLNGVVLMNRKLAAINSLNFDMGNTLTNDDNPNAEEGYDPPVITARKMTGSMDPKETLIATRNNFADFRTGTKRIVHARYGTTAGNRIGITIPQALYKNEEPGDRGGIMTANTPFDATGTDSGAFICFY